MLSVPRTRLRLWGVIVSFAPVFGLSSMMTTLMSSTNAWAEDTGIGIDNMDRSVQALMEKSLPRMACNLSPTQYSKKVHVDNDGVVQDLDIHPEPGSIIASPMKKDPDYLFHWVRDSSLVADSLVRLYPKVKGTAEGKEIRQFFHDYINFTAKLQDHPSKWGLSETRFNADSSVDHIKWSRPQNDGPALRALTLMKFYRENKGELTKEEQDSVRKILRNDLNYVAKVHDQPSFDLWEYIKGDHFYTGLVQLGALEEASKDFPELRDTNWDRSMKNLRARLKNHWNDGDKFYSMTHGDAVDEDNKITPPPGSPAGMDTSVIMAVGHARAQDKDFSFRDSKMLATTNKLEKFFRSEFPINSRDAETSLGPAIGRHKGDGYYGGNAFYFLTGGYSEFYFNMARYYRDHPKEPIVVDKLNQEFFNDLTGKKMNIGANVVGTAEQRKDVVEKLTRKGEAFLNTMLRSIPADGNLYEQFGKKDGAPASSPDLTWSYASVLQAALNRETLRGSKVDYSKLDFHCKGRRSLTDPAAEAAKTVK